MKLLVHLNVANKIDYRILRGNALTKNFKVVSGYFRYCPLFVTVTNLYSAGIYKENKLSQSGIYRCPMTKISQEYRTPNFPERIIL